MILLYNKYNFVPVPAEFLQGLRTNLDLIIKQSLNYGKNTLKAPFLSDD